MEWFRLYHGTVSDKKWPLIARKSGQPKHVVVAVWLAMLEAASEADERGSLEGFDSEETDAMLDLPDGASAAIYEVMQERGVIVGNRLAAGIRDE